MEELSAIDKLNALAFPVETRRFQEVDRLGLKMAHYTTAENAALILKNRTIWLRNAQLMNDFSEVTYGSSCLEAALMMGWGGRLETTLDAAHPGLWRAIAEFLNGMEHETRQHTYLTSLSAHKDDDLLGRLSMWRAYGGPTSGVALVFNTEVFEHDSSSLGAYTSPVSYGDQFEMAAELGEMVVNLEENAEIIKQVPFEKAKQIISNALQFSTLSFKHAAFAEEQEWRVLHRPHLDSTTFVRREVETIRGIPQTVCKLPLEDKPGLNMPWLGLDRLLNRIIIGPCVYPQQVASAFEQILRDLGVDPIGKIGIAAIPLRQQG